MFVASDGLVYGHDYVLCHGLFCRIGDIEVVAGHILMLMLVLLEFVALVAQEVWVAAFVIHVVVARPFVFSFGMQLAVIEPVVAPLAMWSSSS